MISPIVLLQVILQTTAALQTFNQPKILTNGGPGFSTKVLMLSIYENGFPTLGRIPQLGYASAQVWVLFVIIICVIALTATNFETLSSVQIKGHVGSLGMFDHGLKGFSEPVHSFVWADWRG